MKVWQGNFRVKIIIVGIATFFFYLLYSLDIDILSYILVFVEKILWLSSWKEC